MFFLDRFLTAPAWSSLRSLSVSPTSSCPQTPSSSTTLSGRSLFHCIHTLTSWHESKESLSFKNHAWLVVLSHKKMFGQCGPQRPEEDSLLRHWRGGGRPPEEPDEQLPSVHCQPAGNRLARQQGQTTRVCCWAIYLKMEYIIYRIYTVQHQCSTFLILFWPEARLGIIKWKRNLPCSSW